MAARFLAHVSRGGVVVFVCLTFMGCQGRPSPAAPTTLGAMPARELVHQLASGGYVIFFRHAARDLNVLATTDLAVVDNAGECVPGSALTEAGAVDARALGAAFVRLGVGVDKVHASPTCRTIQMASLMFPDHATTRALSWPGMWYRDEEAFLTAELIDLLGTLPAPSLNTVLISHNDVLQAGRVGVGISLEQSEAAIFRPGGAGAFELIGRITKEEWTTLVGIPAGAMQQ
ncbi:MAG TPA: hypothetical protein VK886_05120 [Vicinamibacterales bacterium]|nr:hypothetical protein [Vicinamibacterales bacterium]